MDGIKGWFSSIPVVSRYLFAACLGIPILVSMNVLDGYSLIADFSLTFKSFQLWRLFTAPCFISPLGPVFLFNLIFFYQYTTRLESINFSGKSDDYFFLVICVSIFNTIFGYLLGIGLLGSMTIMSLIYMYSRLNPTGVSNFYGFFSFKTIYLPWVFLVAHFLQSGAPPYSDFCAIVSGHIFFYLTDVYPRSNQCAPLIKTPRFISNLFSQAVRNPNNQPIDPRTGRFQTQHQQQNQQGGYNWGQGRALG